MSDHEKMTAEEIAKLRAENKAEDEHEREEIGSQYPCSKSCRICPFPGVRCRYDDATARKII